MRRVLLRFGTNAKQVKADISAIAHDPDGYVWLGSDELTTIERLSPISESEYAEHQPFLVSDYVALKDSQDEIDIEGMDYSAGYLWVVGSHSTKRKRAKGEDADKDIRRLTQVVTDENRFLIARLPIVKGEPVSRDGCTGRSAAALESVKGRSVLLEMLKNDEHIGAFIRAGLPSKENGFDIEAIAVQNQRVFLGLRGPVLRGMAIVLELALEEKSDGLLKLEMLENNRAYRKHFLDLNGLGIRDLCFQGDDLIVLAGPTMSVAGVMQVYRFRDAIAHTKDTLWMCPSDSLTKLCDLPFHDGNDKAEGITLLSTDELMIVHDSPGEDRIPCQQTLLADVYSIS